MIRLILIMAIAVSFSSEMNAGSYKVNNIDGKNYSLKVKDVNGQNFAPLDKLHKIIFPGSSYDAGRNIISFEGQSLKIMPASFFIVHDKDNDLRIAQMTLPAIDMNNQVYVPVETFINTLQTLNIYDVNIEKKHISINYITKIGKLVIPKKIAPKKENEIKESVDLTERESAKNTIPLVNIDPNDNTLIKKSFAKASGNFLAGLGNISDINNMSITTLEAKVKKKKDKVIEAEPEPEIPEELYEDETKFPPNLYVLPPALIRKELEEGEK